MRCCFQHLEQADPPEELNPHGLEPAVRHRVVDMTECVLISPLDRDLDHDRELCKQFVPGFCLHAIRQPQSGCSSKRKHPSHRPAAKGCLMHSF